MDCTILPVDTMETWKETYSNGKVKFKLLSCIKYRLRAAEMKFSVLVIRQNYHIP